MDHFRAKSSILASTFMHTCISFQYKSIVCVEFYQKTWSWTSPLVLVCDLSQCLDEELPHVESFLVSQTETATNQTETKRDQCMRTFQQLSVCWCAEPGRTHTDLCWCYSPAGGTLLDGGCFVICLRGLRTQCRLLGCQHLIQPLWKTRKRVSAK